MRKLASRVKLKIYGRQIQCSLICPDENELANSNITDMDGSVLKSLLVIFSLNPTAKSNGVEAGWGVPSNGRSSEY